MSKAYKVISRTIPLGERKGETVYTVSPVSYGTLTTEEVAKQISMESTATPADVKAVLDRYAYYVRENLKKGYDVELLGFGTVTLRFLKDRSVTSYKEANARLVRCLIPAFRPSYTMLNNCRVYSLIPDRITLVKYGEEEQTKETSEPSDPSDDGSDTDTGNTGNTGNEGGSDTGGNYDSFS